MDAITVRELDAAFDQYRTGFADALSKHGIAAYVIGDRRGVAKVTRRKAVRKNAVPNINYDAATAYLRQYRDDLINRGGTYVWDNKLKQMKFVPWLQDGSDEMRRQVEIVIEDGFKEGKSSVKVTRDLRQYFDDNDIHDPEKVARTERARLESEGERSNYREQDIGLLEWVLGDKACEQCEEIASQDVGYGAGIYPIDDCPPIPQHPGCLVPDTRCESPSDIIAGLRSFYNGPVIQITASNGSEITVTPNHMFLTSNGFISADLLCEGDDILCRAGSKGIVSNNPDDDRQPPTIQEIFDSLIVSGGVRTCGVPVSPEDLHGDAVFGDGNIDIVRANGFLGHTGKPGSGEHINALPLNKSGQNGFSCKGSLASLLHTLADTTDGGMSGSRVPHPLFRARPSRTKELGLASIPQINTVTDQALINGSPSDMVFAGKSEDTLTASVISNDHVFRQGDFVAPKGDPDSIQSPANGSLPTRERIGDLLNIHPGLIEICHIVSVNVVQFCGHVYDLQTSSTLYIGAGFVLSNCECDTAPVPGGA